MKTIAILSLLLLATGCSNPPDVRDCAVPRANQTRMIAFGDSQTQGVASATGFCQYSYAYNLAESLNLNLVNRAIGGTTLMIQGQTGPSQYDMVMGTTFEPSDIVTFQPGFNDIARYGTDEDAIVVFESMLRELVVLMSGQVTHVYLFTPLPMLNYLSPTRTNGSLEAYDMYAAAIHAAAMGLPNVTVIETKPLFALVSSDLADGIHINSDAQTRLATSYLEEMP